ncbi:hypothetical protein L7F22_060256 [Adiantum nelumboides]|nr:hypothetical protein [Adiantum nelumboides]
MSLSKGIWNIVQGIDVCLGSKDVDEIEDVAARCVGSCIDCVVCEAYYYSHIRSAKSAKQAWDNLAGLYAGRNEAKKALLRIELESKIMNEEDDMDTFLAIVKDINEQLTSTGEVISNNSLVQIVLDALPDPYQTFASSATYEPKKS